MRLQQQRIYKSEAAMRYYFRKCIASLVTEWKIRRRFLRSIKEKDSPISSIVIIDITTKRE